MNLKFSKFNFAFCILTFAFIYSLMFTSQTISSVFAYDSKVPNNKFGIHLAQPHFDALDSAKQLVNSNGGDWGYITLVMQENDRNHDKWQDIFNRLRSLHLIPIVRLATVPEGENWKKPNKDDAEDWVNFLDSLNWVVKDRYIVLFNEPNHATEWGGKVDPTDYADVAKTFAEKLKSKNSDFFVMLGAIDASAPQLPPFYMDEDAFLKIFFNTLTIEQFNNLFSGFASHSYPNPGFAGSPTDVGRGTVRTYQWELEQFKNFGIKDLPVFITETGWKRQGNLDENTVAQYFKLAYENVWLPDSRVRAVTPFVLDYQGDPFLGFSWRKFQDSDFYQQYYDVQSMKKIKGEPEQIEKGELIYSLPKELVVESSYNFKIKLKNTGQDIWDKDQDYSLKLIGKNGEKYDYLVNDLKNIKPNDEVEVDLFFKTGNEVKNYSLEIALFKGDKKILSGDEWRFTTLPLPSLSFKVSLFPKFLTSAEDFDVQIFDDKENLIFRKNNLTVNQGVGNIDNIQNIVLGKMYRVVIIKPYYLPRQEFVVFKRGENQTEFKRMYPWDFNGDGKLSLQDLITLFKNPQLFSLLIP